MRNRLALALGIGALSLIKYWSATEYTRYTDFMSSKVSKLSYPERHNTKTFTEEQ